MKTKLLFFVVLFFAIQVSTSQTIDIPDANFEQALIDLNYDTDGIINQSISAFDAAQPTFLFVNNKNISSLQGIEGFINLRFLTCSDNQLTSLDLSNNVLLESLQTYNNQITDLNLSNNVLLESLHCYNNLITSLDLSSNSLLVEINVSINELSYLNVKNGNNQNVTLFGALGNLNLSCIEVDDANYSSTNWLNIDAQASFSESCPTIAIPDANFEQALIDLGYDTNGLTGDILQGEAEAVESLYINDKNIASLQGIEGFINLETLDCYNNQLTNLDLSSNTALRIVQCFGNQLETLLVNNNPALININTRDNNLTSLDVSSCVALEVLNIFNNNIVSIDASNQPAFRFFLGDNNNLSSLNVKNGNNQNVSGFSIVDNPNLTCVEVDNVSYSESNWTSIDAQTSFDTTCSNEPVIAIPDPNFEQALIDLGFDTNGLNSNILQTEAEAINTTLNLTGKEINSLQGIEGFINITHLRCNNNNLTTLDISSNTALTILECSNNDLSTINISNNVALLKLSCSNNDLTSLDVSSNPLLANITINDNLISFLDLSNNPNLTDFNAHRNELVSLDVSNNPLLEGLNCGNNLITSLDVSTNTVLEALDCRNNQLQTLNVKNGNNSNFVFFKATGNSNLTCILVDNVEYSNTNWFNDVDAQTSFNDVECILQTITIPDANFEQTLIDLGFDTNGITGDILQTEAEAVTFLDVSNKNIANLQGIEGFINLITLHCYTNQLTSLDVSSNTALVELSCNTNQITSLDLSNNLLLQRLYCSGNELTVLDVSANETLTQINCFSNQLQSLNVKNGNNTNFTLFNATNNPNLFCVEVDDFTYSQNNWTNIDAQTSFGTICSNEPVIAIPDPNFEQVLINLGIDTNGNTGNILQTEAEAVTSLLISGANINSLQGIEGFINLTSLNCNFNNLTTLDLSSNTTLTILECASNNLTDININNNVALVSLTCSNNELISLDTSNNPLLNSLFFSNNQVANLEISNNTLLKEINFANNLISNLDLSNNLLLEKLVGLNNSLINLDVSNNELLTVLDCRNNVLESLNVKNGNNDNMSFFDAQNNPNLMCVQVDNVAYSTTNWSANVDAQVSFSTNCATIAIPDANFEQALIDLGYDNNGLNGNILQTEAEAVTFLDVSSESISSLEGIEGFINLTILVCQDNNISNLDVSNNLELVQLVCRNNQLSSIDVSANTVLENLDCLNNQVEVLDLSNNTALIALIAENNQLESLNIKNGNNENVTFFNVLNNPNLICIEVDDAAYSTANWSTYIDTQTNFSENCGTLVIPDINFEQALIGLGIDTNGLNGNIFQFQAEAIILLDVSNKNISSLQGIEGFINLEVLKCQDNNLPSLDISNNLNLQQLDCRNNQLSNLDVSANIALENLNCFNNQIEALDLGNNATLKFLLCDDNDLESLNIKNGNNENVTFFSALNNSKLNCIEVDNLAYSNTNWSNNVDAQSSFSEDCGATLTINEVNTLDNVKLYPNPTSDNFFIKGLQEEVTIKIYDINSKLIISRIINNSEAINLDNVPSGLYFVNISNTTSSTIKKLIIQ